MPVYLLISFILNVMYLEKSVTVHVYDIEVIKTNTVPNDFLCFCVHSFNIVPVYAFINNDPFQH